MMSDMTRIAALSTGLYRIVTVLLVVLPVLLLVFLVRGWLNPDDLMARFPGVAQTVSPPTALIVTLIGAISLPPLLMALAQARALFARYRAGEILSDACAGHIHRIGQMLVVLAFLGIVVPTLQVLALSWTNPPGQKMLQIGLSSDSLGFLVAGGLLTVIGWVMREAARIKAENEGFV
jgi:hypothetical protein